MYVYEYVCIFYMVKYRECMKMIIMKYRGVVTPGLEIGEEVSVVKEGGDPQKATSE